MPWRPLGSFFVLLATIVSGIRCGSLRHASVRECLLTTLEAVATVVYALEEFGWVIPAETEMLATFRRV